MKKNLKTQQKTSTNRKTYHAFSSWRLNIIAQLTHHQAHSYFMAVVAFLIEVNCSVASTTKNCDLR